MNTPVAQRFAPGSYRLSCVVPAYNEAALIGDFLPQLVAAVRDLTADVEIVVVNDGSRDATGEIVTQLCAQLPQAPPPGCCCLLLLQQH